MLARRQLLRQGRSILTSKPSSATSPLTVQSLPQATLIQTRSLRTEDIKLHIPASAGGKTLTELVNDGTINQNVAQFLHDRKVQDKIGHLGAKVDQADLYQPHTLLNNPPPVEEVTLELLLASQAHLGHSTSLWHPGNARYIFGIREGIHIISLEETAAHLRRAAKVVQGVAERAGLILFVGTRKGLDRAVVKAAQLSGGYYIFDKWVPGSMTNGDRILARGALKVVDEMDRELLGFGEQLQSAAFVKPDLVVIMNPGENWPLLHECSIYNIPTIGVIDTNVNPARVTYPIPANDDSLRCIQLIAGVLGRAGEKGRNNRLARADAGHVDFSSEHELVMPSEWEEMQNNTDEEVLDLRGDSNIGTVRYAEPLSEADMAKFKVRKQEAEKRMHEIAKENVGAERKQQERETARKVAKHGTPTSRLGEQYLGKDDPSKPDSSYKRGNRDGRNRGQRRGPGGAGGSGRGQSRS